MPKQVEFFYDFTSPTAYLAWARLPAIAQRTGAKIIYRPMFLGGVMQTTGNRPPGTLPQKARWMAEDLQRWAKKYNTPYNLNPHFPMMTLMVQRAAQEWVNRPDFDKYLAAIFNAAWRDSKNIADKAVLTEVLSAAGFSPEEFFAATENPANKEKLKATTDEAVARGVFGAPTFFVGDEMHFGQDRLDFVEEALARS
ncbi:MAG TPA: 2-hydroxychromene-2-carboxylate isomerase [Hyphomonadaceae bacterium]|jgi:2-hydroxychromene-2-carboxylate isomerase|nr:2-hydroxychromene-2-carboxylate isomerase [Hyphomonadaceae bacterium]